MSTVRYASPSAVGRVLGRVGGHVPALLREVNFRRYWSAQTISFMGDQVSMIALPFVAIAVLDASVQQMALLSAALTAPYLILSIHAGAVVDALGRHRTTMVSMDVVRAVLLLSIPVAYLFGVLTMTQLYLVALLATAHSVVFNVATKGLFATLVPRTSYVSAASLTKGSFSFSWVAGPSLGGALVQMLTAPVAIVVDVASYLASAVLLRSISVDEPARDRSGRARVREGLSFVWRTTTLRVKVIAGALLNLFYSVYFTLLIVFAVRELGLSAGIVGLAIGVGAVGALSGTVVTPRITRRIGLGATFILGSLVYPAALVLVPVADGDRWLAFGLLATAEFVSSVGLMMCDISGSSIQQALTPDRFRARVQGAYMAVVYGTRPVGALLAAGLGAWLGLRTAMLIAVIGGVLSVLPLLWSPIAGMRELPAQAD
ncbi:MAG TPA: MFS transporter [Candidatus Limnocylindrales bacterium]|nr:MFS transporter [Candidatus Limnocylindrales bacterium]